MLGWIEGQLGEKVLSIVPAESGSGTASIVQTDKGRCIAKVGERQDFLGLYEKVLPLLESAGLKQSHIVARCERIVLYEWIAGDTYKVFSEVQTKQKNILKHCEDSRLMKLNWIGRMLGTMLNLWNSFWINYQIPKFSYFLLLLQKQQRGYPRRGI